MPGTKEDKVLITYEKYFDLQKRFNSPYSKDQDGLNEKEFLDETEFKINNRYVFRPILEKLLEHIRNRGIFMSNQDKACNYVSYILSKEVETKGYKYEADTFKMFHDFVNRYNRRPKNTSDICSNSLVHVNSEMYKKMNKLYELYERFKKVLAENVFWEKESCKAVHYFIHDYKYFIKAYQPTNTYYKEILDHFENKIKSNVELYNRHGCPEEKFHIENIKAHIVPKVKKPEAPGPIQQQQNQAKYEAPPAKIPSNEVEHEAPREETRESHALSQRAYEESQTSHAGSGAHNALSQRAHEESLSSPKSLEPIVQHAERQQEQVYQHREIPKSKLQIDLSPEYPPHNGPFEFPGTSLYSERYQHSPEPPSSKEAGDTSSSVMNTITRALKDVEPGPVLGVSGGMGVLFLLFKYTPVGSFFGGRRGRFRQIPSSFRGFPPGDFSNFQEYDGGFIGYGPTSISSLAE
ncbi:unnamed protein product [Plasmodium vivax]|uniref:(malaria parasite P. vivax) hypothetical protein n=1 Tax=Plasmodium vivax TaxID=5855 RepID=A0A8S4HHV3_PLAVI|nr:unnamed protein product [Plasmodium vivax]